jgi:hypothetical protein
MIELKIILQNSEVAAKSLATRLQWELQRGYRAFRLQYRYNLASFMARLANPRGAPTSCLAQDSLNRRA